MKKYVLKKWVEVALYIMESIIFISLIFIIEANPLILICNKAIGSLLFILIGSVLIEYTNMEDE